MEWIKTHDARDVFRGLHDGWKPRDGRPDDYRGGRSVPCRSDWGFYPHHMDKEWCKTQPFRHRMAHGTLVFSVGVGMTAGVINPRAMSYGYDRLRFVRPVFLGDTIRAKISVKEM